MFRRRFLASAVCVLALVLSSCGGSDPGESNASGSNDEVVIGVIGSFTGPFASSTGAMPGVFDAWAKSVNEAGGVNGHNVRIVLKETGTTTGAGLRGAQELLTKEKAAAIIDFDFLGDTTWLKLAEKAKVPVIVPWAGFASLVSPNAFQVSAGPIGLAYSSVAALKEYGDVGALNYAAEGGALGAQYVKMWEKFADKEGFKWAVMAKLPSSSPDYTAYCQQVKNSGADAFHSTLTAALTRKIFKECRQQGVTIPYVVQAGSALPEWKTDPIWEGAQVTDFGPPYFEGSIPGVKKYRDVQAKYNPDLLGSEQDNSNSFQAWAGVQLAEKGLSLVDGEVTGEKMQQAFYTLKDETLDGVMAPMTYTEGETNLNNCYFTWKIKSGEFVAESKEPTCAPDDVVAEAEELLQKFLNG